MKNPRPFLSMLCLAFMPYIPLAAQCDPDTACIDAGTPGEICPDSIPEAFQGEPYELVVTMVIPGAFSFEGFEVSIEYFLIDSVLNIPEGMQWTASSDTLWGDSIFCIDFSGTPTRAGHYPQGIHITPFVSGPLGPIQGSQIVDDTSVVFIVNQSSGLDPYATGHFRLLPLAPNPFLRDTRIGFYSPRDARVNLQVFSLLGHLLHEEDGGFPPGEHFFEYSASNLGPGTYIYRIGNEEEVLSGKFVKTSR